MKKIMYTVIFVVLFFSMSSCNKTEQEIVFLRNERINTIKESSFIENIKNLNLNFKEVILKSDEEFNNYLSDILKSKKISNKTFIVSEEFYRNEIIDNNLIQINGNKDGNYNLSIYQKDLVYLLGVISGMVTKTNNVAVIYSSNFKDYPEYMLSFIAGIKMVNLRAYDSLLNGVNTFNTADLSEENKSSSIVSFIEDNKSDVFLYLDKGILENLSVILDQKEKTIFSLNDFVENDYLKVSYVYDDVTNKSFDSGNYVLSLMNNTINVDLTNLPEEVKLVAENTLSKIMSGNIYIPSNLNELKEILVR